jgi:hypothetical protein
LGPGWNARLAETTNEGMPIHRMLWMKREQEEVEAVGECDIYQV